MFQLSYAASLNLGWSQNRTLGDGLKHYDKKNMLMRFVIKNAHHKALKHSPKYPLRVMKFAESGLIHVSHKTCI